MQQRSLQACCPGPRGRIYWQPSSYPPLRGKMAWLAATMQLQDASTPVQHHPAMPWEVALLLAFGLRQLGRPGDAAALVAQWRLGLRPGEAVQLSIADYRPSRGAGELGVVRVGTARGTKSRRPEFTRVYNDDHALLFLLRLSEMRRKT